MQMNARNLAVCFAPSLFHACAGWKTKTSTSREGPPRRARRRRAVRVEEGILSEKDMEVQRAAHECLTTMIVSAKDLFTVRLDHNLYLKTR